MADENITQEEGERNLKLQESRQDQVTTAETASVETPEKKVGSAEAIIMLSVAGAGDGFSTLLFYMGAAITSTSITGIGIVLAPFAGISWIAGSMIKIATWFTIDMWVLTRGFKRPKFFVASGGIDLIPGIGDVLPTYIGKVAIIIIYNNGLPWLRRSGAARLLEHVT